MDIDFPFKVSIVIPGDLEYIPPVRKFISEMLQVANFNQKFAYRSEIIVDEICNNAVNYGCLSQSASVELICEVFDDRIEFFVKDQGGKKEHIKRLQLAIHSDCQDLLFADRGKGLGLEIVRMLSEKVDLKIDEENLTSVHIVRKRENT